MSTFDKNRCEQSEVTCAYAAQALAASEVAAAEAHMAACPECRRELASLRPVVDRFVSWPTDVLRPTTSLQERLARRIAEETGKEPVLLPARPTDQAWREQTWSEPQACPQAPQFAPLVSRSTHAVPQAVPPDGQVQVPLLHDCALPQAWPQAPQLALLVWTSTHTPPQGASPMPQPEAAPH